MMKHVILFVALAALTSGCGMLNRLKPAPKAPAVEIVAPVEATVTLPAMGAGQTAAALDQTSAAEKAAATAPAASGARDLGRTTVALGSPAEQGFWLKSPLVSVPGKGRVVTAQGASVAVDLIPGSGGSLLSLAAYRALGLSLTDLPEVTVLAD